MISIVALLSQAADTSNPNIEIEAIEYECPGIKLLARRQYPNKLQIVFKGIGCWMTMTIIMIILNIRPKMALARLSRAG